MTWQHRAACRDVDPDTMQPDRPRPSQMFAAASICHRCPAFADCERVADEHQAYGVWAGRWHGLYEPVGVFDVINEQELRAMLAAGYSVRDIARRLDVTKRQVEDAQAELTRSA